LNLSSNEYAPTGGSSKSAEFHFPPGSSLPDSGAAIRKKFTAVDDFYAEFYVKYSSGWVGSGQGHHPHEIFVLTNIDGDYAGMANTHTTVYIEENALNPQLIVQDAKNINTAMGSLPNNLVGQTEIRSVAGCNGDSDGHGEGNCYQSSGIWYNNKHYDYGSPAIKDGEWHKVVAHFKLNSIQNGIAQADGELQYWLDDNLLINHNNVMIRTGQHPDMKFNQFVISPYIGAGSPIDQTMWLDNLKVSTDIQPPTNLRIVESK
jgi:hypothetical protein